MEKDKDTKATYNLLKSQAGWTTSNTPTSFLQAGKTTNSPQKIADIQMNYFHNKIIKIQN